MVWHIVAYLGLWTKWKFTQENAMVNCSMPKSASQQLIVMRFLCLFLTHQVGDNFHYENNAFVIYAIGALVL